MRIMVLQRAFCACLVALASSVNAQTLDEQYEFFLSARCEELAFSRDPFDLVPGQAGPNLTQFCNTPETGGFGLIVVNAPSGGGAAASVGRGSAMNDAAVKRRREQAREESTASIDTIRGGAAGADMSWANGLGLFVSTDYREESQAVTHYEGGRDSDSNTLTLGADYRFGSLLAGIALQRSRLAGDFDSGGDFEARSNGLAMYASWLPVDALFVDLSLSSERKSLDTSRIVGRTVYKTPDGGGVTQISYEPAYAPVYGDTEGRSRRADVLVGYDISIGRFALGPRVGANYLKNVTDAYLETGQSAMSLAFGEQEEESLQTALGLQASMAFTTLGVVLAPQVNVNWINEHRNDQRAITARFAEDLRANPKYFTFLNQPPDRDLYTARISVVAVFRNGISAFMSAEKMYKHTYREQAGASLGMRWEL